MSTDTKIIKGRCKKTGQYYGLETKKFGSSYEVINMVLLSEEEKDIIQTEIREPNLRTHSNLLACKKCGNRKVSGCSCLKRSTRCKKGMPYNLDCIYCDEFEVDYSRSKGKNPYSKWAGISNIPGAIKDKYGNPQGSEYDLAVDGSFKGYTIVVLFLCTDSTSNFIEPRRALEKKGFEIIEYNYNNLNYDRIKNDLKNDKSQLWVISDRNIKLNSLYYDLIIDYMNKHHGVYIWGDNNPYYQDANQILVKRFGLSMSGDYYGDKVLSVQREKYKAGIIKDHPITTGIQNFYEGITIANVDIRNVLTPLIYDSSNKIVTAYYDKDNMRVLIDGGFTRLYYKWNSAGTDRYIVNAAAWLANIEYFGYQ